MNHNSVPLTVQLVKTVKSAEMVEDTSGGQEVLPRPKLKRRRYGCCHRLPPGPGSL
jgi:hypothetical protein